MSDEMNLHWQEQALTQHNEPEYIEREVSQSQIEWEMYIQEMEKKGLVDDDPPFFWDEDEKKNEEVVLFTEDYKLLYLSDQELEDHHNS